LSVKNSDETTGLTGEERMKLLRSRIRLHAALGIEAYPANDSLRRFLALPDKSTGDSANRHRKEQDGGKTVATEDRLLHAREKIALLREEISGCACCRLAQEKTGSVPGKGTPACALMIVGDYSLQETGAFSQDVLFGREEDVMLGKMMAAIDLGREDIYVSNCLKCCPGGEGEPESASVKSCFSFLEREIALIHPRIICAMGEVAAGTLTGSSEPLARLRGKFVRYRYQAGSEILVMPTYHPRFLRRHREMKKATWLDLQAIRKKLAGMK